MKNDSSVFDFEYDKMADTKENLEIVPSSQPSLIVKTEENKKPRNIDDIWADSLKQFSTEIVGLSDVCLKDIIANNSADAKFNEIKQLIDNSIKGIRDFAISDAMKKLDVKIQEHTTKWLDEIKSLQLDDHKILSNVLDAFIHSLYREHINLHNTRSQVIQQIIPAKK